MLPLATIAIVEFIVGTYVFLFQYYTRGIARRIDAERVPTLQLKMTPAWMGALGWLATILWLAAIAIALYSLGFWYAVAYVVARFIIGNFVPEFPFRRHFNSLASHEAARQTVAAIDDPDGAAVWARLLEEP